MYKHNLAIFCKTCYRDVENLKILLESITKYNAEKIPVCLCFSRKEKELLLPIINNYQNNITVFFDEDICTITDKYNDQFMQDWMSQQYVKLNFYKTNFAKHYLLIDTDCYFIKEFRIKNFLYKEEIPYLPITGHTKAERLPLQLIYQNDLTFNRELDAISKFLDYEGNNITIDMPFVLSSEYMQRFDEYLKNKNYTFKDILSIVPNEMQWYLEFCIANELKYKYTTSFFFPMHIDAQYQIFRWLGYDENIIKKNYLGILMNKGHVKSLKFRPLWIGTCIIRPLIRILYLLTRKRYDYPRKYNLFAHIFSIKNEYRTNGKKYKVLTILGIKMKFRIHNI